LGSNDHPFKANTNTIIPTLSRINPVPRIDTYFFKMLDPKSMDKHIETLFISNEMRQKYNFSCGLFLKLA
jgi:hypothetical protein